MRARPVSFLNTSAPQVEAVKNKVQTTLISALFLWVSSCVAPPQTPVPPTDTPRPRPITEYGLGGWHEEIASEMEKWAGIGLRNSGHLSIDFEIEITPATSLQDELVFLKYTDWPESADSDTVWSTILLTVVLQSERYDLHPQAIVAVQHHARPYGDFVTENDNIRGFCEIPLHSTRDYIYGRHDVSTLREFLDTWECAYR